MKPSLIGADYLLILAAVLVVLGCSSKPAAIEVPLYNPGAFASSLLDRCDDDRDGAISKQEAEKSSGLLSAWRRYDASNDGTISREELESHAQAWLDENAGLASISCIVDLGGQQLDDVSVKLVPDASLATVVEPAVAVSRSTRPSFFSLPAELRSASHKNLSGMKYGLYRVEVSHPELQLAPSPLSLGVDVSEPDQSAPIVIRVDKK
jgi:hypothetical protein